MRKRHEKGGGWGGGGQQMRGDIRVDCVAARRARNQLLYRGRVSVHGQRVMGAHYRKNIVAPRNDQKLWK